MHLLVLAAAACSLAGVSGMLLYPHGTAKGDVKGPVLDDDYEEQPLPTPLILYGYSHSTSFVNENGAMSFLDSFWEFIPEPLPGDNDMPLVLPFWADISVEDGGKIFSRTGTDKDLLYAVTDDIHASFSGCHKDFHPTGYVIATWKKVMAYCFQEGHKYDGENTIQMVFVTDGTESYVVFNFDKMDWVMACPGEPTVVGFNAGDGRYFELPHSGTKRVRKLLKQTNANMAGRWIYKVSGAGIMDSDCDPVEDYSCECHSTNNGNDVTKYDLSATTLTETDKFNLSNWEFDGGDACKFRIVAKPNAGSTHLSWVAVYVGVHKENSDKFHANWRMDNGDIIRRGQGIPAGSSEVPSLPAHYVSPDGLTDLHIVQEGNTFQFHSTLCPFAFHVTQDAIDHSIISDVDIWIGDRYQDGNLEGTCGNCPAA